MQYHNKARVAECHVVSAAEVTADKLLYLDIFYAAQMSDLLETETIRVSLTQYMSSHSCWTVCSTGPE